MLLEHDTEEAFEAAAQRAVQHHRRSATARCIHILDAETLGQEVIDLNRAALPDTARSIDQGELEFRPVEGTASGGAFERKSSRSRTLGQGCLGASSQLFALHTRLRSFGQHDAEPLKAEDAIELLQRLTEGRDLFDDLFVSAQDVSVILHELTQAKEAG